MSAGSRDGQRLWVKSPHLLFPTTVANRVPFEHPLNALANANDQTIKEEDLPVKVEIEGDEGENVEEPATAAGAPTVRYYSPSPLPPLSLPPPWLPRASLPARSLPLVEKRNGRRKNVNGATAYRDGRLQPKKVSNAAAPSTAAGRPASPANGNAAVRHQTSPTAIKTLQSVQGVAGTLYRIVLGNDRGKRAPAGRALVIPPAPRRLLPKPANIHTSSPPLLRALQQPANLQTPPPPPPPPPTVLRRLLPKPPAKPQTPPPVRSDPRGTVGNANGIAVRNSSFCYMCSMLFREKTESDRGRNKSRGRQRNVRTRSTVGNGNGNANNRRSGTRDLFCTLCARHLAEVVDNDQSTVVVAPPEGPPSPPDC